MTLSRSERPTPALAFRFRSRPKTNVLILSFLLLCGCHGRANGPSVEFSEVPPNGEGGPLSTGLIAGRVTGARAGQEIVIFARSGPQWWVQPATDQPFTKIRRDHTWSTSTHLGTEYAALLVDRGYSPPNTTQFLPHLGPSIFAVAEVKGLGPPVVDKFIQFSGYQWKVRTASSDRGGFDNKFDAGNVWTDHSGALHLRISPDPGRGTCAEVNLTRSLGYGSYRFVIKDISQLPPTVAFEMFTWDDLDVQEHKDMDIQLSRWGDATGKNAQYMIQPYYVPTNVVHFMVPSGALTFSFRWEPGKASFRTVEGSQDDPEGPAVAQHVFTTGIPEPGGESVHLGFYIVGRGTNLVGNPVEVVVDKFEYLP